MIFLSPHLGQRRCHETLMIYSDILKVLEKAGGDGRHLSEIMDDPG